MLENPNGKFNPEFKIHFGNLKQDYKENYYLASTERAYENKTANCLMIIEKNFTKYAIIKDNNFEVPITKYINLGYFEDWHCRMNFERGFK